MGLIDARLVLDAPELRRERDLLIRGYLGAGKQALTETIRDAELQLEALTKAAAPGNLYRAWKSEVSPKGARIARDPAAFIFLNGGSRTRGAVTFLIGNGRVQSKTDGGYLAIPLPAAGSRGRTRNLTPGDWERANGVRLRYVYRGRNKPALLVADVGTTGAKGSFRPITRKRTAADAKRGFVRGEQTVPIFVLIAPFNFSGKFSTAPVLNRMGAALRDNFERRANAIGDINSAPARV